MSPTSPRPPAWGLPFGGLNEGIKSQPGIGGDDHNRSLDQSRRSTNLFLKVARSFAGRLAPQRPGWHVPVTDEDTIELIRMAGRALRRRPQILSRQGRRAAKGLDFPAGPGPTDTNGDDTATSWASRRPAESWVCPIALSTGGCATGSFPEHSSPRAAPASTRRRAALEDVPLIVELR